MPKKRNVVKNNQRARAHQEKRRRLHEVEDAAQEWQQQHGSLDETFMTRTLESARDSIRQHRKQHHTRRVCIGYEQGGRSQLAFGFIGCKDGI